MSELKLTGEDRVWWVFATWKKKILSLIKVGSNSENKSLFS